MSRHAFICDAVRTTFGRYGGVLASVRADDLGALPLAALMARNAAVDTQGAGPGRLQPGHLDVIELNEAFAAQGLAVLPINHTVR